MRPLLVDSDAFCKLGIAGLLETAAAIFGVAVDDCGCLPALQYMLRRGRLRKGYGDANCDKLIGAAERMAVELRPSAEWLDKLTGIDQIDIGEAQLLAGAAESELILVTSDKRALAAVARVPGYAEKLAGRVATLEAVLLSLCVTLGDDEVRAAVQPLAARDITVQICDSTECLPLATAPSSTLAVSKASILASCKFLHRFD